MSTNVKIPLSEYEKTDSQYSAMRKGFFWIIKLIIAIASSATAAYIVGSFVKRPLSMDGIVALIACLGVVAFGGKAVQTFGERPLPNVSSDKATAAITNIVDKIEKTMPDTDKTEDKKDPNEAISK